MDSNRNKRRSFSKSKIVRTFYRAATGTKPPTSGEYPSSGGAAGSAVGFIIVNQNQVFPQQTPTVAAIVVADRKRDSYGKLESFYGGADDEGVDAKAAKYISSVQERFRLERVNSERNTFDQIHL